MDKSTDEAAEAVASVLKTGLCSGVSQALMRRLVEAGELRRAQHAMGTAICQLGLAYKKIPENTGDASVEAARSVIEGLVSEYIWNGGYLARYGMEELVTAALECWALSTNTIADVDIHLDRETLGVRRTLAAMSIARDVESKIANGELKSDSELHIPREKFEGFVCRVVDLAFRALMRPQEVHKDLLRQK